MVTALQYPHGMNGSYTYKRPPPVLMLKELERPKPAMLCCAVLCCALLRPEPNPKSPVLSCPAQAICTCSAETCIGKIAIYNSRFRVRVG